jgi:hypothetical protein
MWPIAASRSARPRTAVAAGSGRLCPKPGQVQRLQRAFCTLHLADRRLPLQRRLQLTNRRQQLSRILNTRASPCLNTSCSAVDPSSTSTGGNVLTCHAAFAAPE